MDSINLAIVVFISPEFQHYSFHIRSKIIKISRSNIYAGLYISLANITINSDNK